LVDRGFRETEPVTSSCAVSVFVGFRFPPEVISVAGAVVDVLLSVRRDLAAARRFFTRALRAGTVPAEVTTA
jgi:hypothetical protein